QVRELSLEVASLSREWPHWISVDQEGGRVARLRRPFTEWPPMMTLGRSGDPELAGDFASALAAELRAAGVNLDYTPVLDIHTNSKNPVIGDRALGTTADVVAAFGAALIRKLHEGGIVACGKHFPGHGDADKDSHFDLPIVRKSMEELQAIELAPFADACRNQIESLMTAHVAYPALDPKLPATLSEAIVTGLLRHQLGYDGVVFSDDLAMRAISDRYSVDEAAALAVRAGVDVLLFCHEIDKAAAAFEFLCAEAERDPVLRARVEESYRRVTELKRRYLTRFTGVAENDIIARLAELNHRKLLNELV
ncbi:MAG TPA: beta-N-acetylhexosaminidase, partial [Candidatus Deferrimicrobium sp.]|nr:beta-N-acetylhexosaminidase [Candidatus Deferrimicrobium sp.]